MYGGEDQEPSVAASHTHKPVRVPLGALATFSSLAAGGRTLWGCGTSVQCEHVLYSQEIDVLGWSTYYCAYMLTSTWYGSTPCNRVKPTLGWTNELSARPSPSAFPWTLPSTFPWGLETPPLDAASPLPAPLPLPVKNDERRRL